MVEDGVDPLEKDTGKIWRIVWRRMELILWRRIQVSSGGYYGGGWSGSSGEGYR